MTSTLSRPPCAAGGILVNSMVGSVLSWREWHAPSAIETISGRAIFQPGLVSLHNLIHHHPYSAPPWDEKLSVLNPGTAALKRRYPPAAAPFTNVIYDIEHYHDGC